MKLSQTNGPILHFYDGDEYASLLHLKNAGFKYVDISFWSRYTSGSRYFTESNDKIADDGRVHDDGRVKFLASYLSELERASDNGVDIRGYFLWSFMDNFEWNLGYGPRFGIVYVDYESLKRTPKDSAYWYKSFIEKHTK